MRAKPGIWQILVAGALALGAVTGWTSSASAQCTLASAPVSFEPSPPGAPRPYLLYGGYDNAFQIFRSGGQARILMSESFGYSVLDIQSNPTSPYALVYDDMRNDGVLAHGDGQTYIASLGVSDDGQRAAFSINGPGTPPWGTVVGQGSGSVFSLGGDFSMPGATQGMVIQRLGSRYIAYALAGSVLAVADVTALPGLTPGDIPAERVSGVPGGGALYLAGNKVVVTNTGSGTIILDASNPGPVGAIASGFTQVLVTPADWGMASDADAVVAAADPANSAKTWLLGEFATSPPTYKLMSVQGTTKSLNPRAYQIPVVAGETWNATYTMPGLVGSANGLVALMWARRSSPTAATQLHSAPVSAWSSSTFGVIDLTSTGITPAAIKGQAGSGNSVYTYIATGAHAYAIPLSCLTVPAPPISNLTVEPVPCPGASPCPLNPNDTVFVGQTLKVTPTVITMHALTDWRFDFDWHPPAEDNGSRPHLKTPDLSYPSNGAVPPATITLAGPCDPTSGGAPGTGIGCWASVAANGDFPANAPAGTTATLQLALEAANDLGPGDTKTFPLTWKVPAVRLQNTNVLLNAPLQSAAEGTPLVTGYKWYFGTSSSSLALSSCTGPSCIPPAPYNGKGTYYFWLTVPYASYTSPDCGSPCTQNLGTYMVTDVAVSVTNVPTTVFTSHPVNLKDASAIAGGVLACGTGYQYSVCDSAAPACVAGAGLSWIDIAIPRLGSASFTAPSTPATYWLRVRYNYTTTGTCPSLSAPWTPTVSGVSDVTAWPLVVAPVPPMIFVRVNGLDPCPPGPGGGCTSGFPANVGDVVTVWADLQGIGHDPAPPSTTLWTFGSGASPSSCAGSGCQGVAFTFTEAGPWAISLSGYPGVPTPVVAAFAVDVPPVVAHNGGPVCAGSPLSLTATPTLSGATYAWTGPNGFTSTQQSPTIPVATTAATGTYTVVRTFGGLTSQSATTALVKAPPAVPVAGSSGPLCAGQTLALTAATVGGATYAWTGPNGFTSAQQNPTIVNVTPAASGTYVVTATVAGCSTGASTSVTVGAPPAAPAAGNSGPLCTGGTLQLTAAAIAGATYAWTGPNGFASNLQNPAIPNVASAAAGTYSVTAAVGGCAGPAGTTTAVVNGPSAAISAPSRICLSGGSAGAASVPDAGAGATYTWTIANGAITGGQGSPSIAFSVAGAGTTVLGVTVTEGTCSASSSVNVDVAATCAPAQFIPTAPCRAIDSRLAAGPLGGPSLGPGPARAFPLAGVCGIPANAVAVSAIITATDASASGNLILFPGTGAVPNVNGISFRPGVARANNMIIPVSADGTATFSVQNTSGGSLNFLCDVNGYFQ